VNAAELAARAHAAPRDFAAVTVDLAEAATRLRGLAGALRLGGPSREALAEVDRVLVGCNSLLCELRQGQAA
jgi:hypothetical protein